MRSALFIPLSLMLALMCGCAPGGNPSSGTSSDHADHDHNHGQAHPETLSDAVAAIAKMGASIVDAFKAGKPEDAHDDLHEIGHLIEELPELGMKASLSPDTTSKVEELTEKLVLAFGALDESLHGGDGKSIDDAQVEIDGCVKELQSLMPQ